MPLTPISDPHAVIESINVFKSNTPDKVCLFVNGPGSEVVSCVWLTPGEAHEIASNLQAAALSVLRAEVPA